MSGEQVQGIDSRQVLVLMDGLPVMGARGVKGGAINLNRQASGPLDHEVGERGQIWRDRTLD